MISTLIVACLFLQPHDAKSVPIEVRVKHSAPFPGNKQIRLPNGQLIPILPRVGPNGEVPRAIVFVRRPAADAPELRAAQAKTVDIAFDGLVFNPPVSAVVIGQPIKVANKDNQNHAFHTLPRKQRPVLTTMSPGQIEEIFFKRTEIVKLKCDLHPWEWGFVGVFEHMDHDVTDDNGIARLNLPAGKHRIVVWHGDFDEIYTDLIITSEQIEAQEPIVLNPVFEESSADGK